MKKIFAALILITTFTNAFCQKQPLCDSFTTHYDLLNNMPFAELQLEDTSGNLFNTATLLGKTLYVDFWFTTCPPCVKEIPYAKELQAHFATDTNIVFLSICIENIQRKPAWKQMIQEKKIPGLHLFYARNRPQKINLLRRYNITFPTYLLVNKEMKVTGYDAPRPSERGWVHWAILSAKEGRLLSQSYREVVTSSPEYKAFIEKQPAELIY